MENLKRYQYLLKPLLATASLAMGLSLSNPARLNADVPDSCGSVAQTAITITWWSTTDGCYHEIGSATCNTGVCSASITACPFQPTVYNYGNCLCWGPLEN